MKTISQIISSSPIRTITGLGFLLILAILVTSCGGAAPEPSTGTPPPVTEQAVEVAPTEIPPTPVPSVDMDQIVDVLWVLLGYGDAADPYVVE